MVRQIDKARAELHPSDAAVLMAIALHADADGHAFPGEALLAAETGIGVRTVSRSVARLRERGIVDVTQGRQHAPNRYALRHATMATLPTIQARHHGDREDSGSPPATSRVATSDIQGSQGGVLSIREDPNKYQGAPPARRDSSNSQARGEAERAASGARSPSFKPIAIVRSSTKPEGEHPMTPEQTQAALAELLAKLPKHMR